MSGTQQEEVGPPTLPVSVTVELQREGVRATLAFILLGIFAVEVAIALLSQLGHPSATMKDMIGVIFGPTVALVGSALGFYYGTKPDTKSG